MRAKTKCAKFNACRMVDGQTRLIWRIPMKPEGLTLNMILNSINDGKIVFFLAEMLTASIVILVINNTNKLQSIIL